MTARSPAIPQRYWELKQMRQDIRRHRPFGFSLLELMCVLVLISTLSAVAIFKFSGPFRRVRFETDCRLVKDFDGSARRRLSREVGCGELCLNLDENTIERRFFQKGHVESNTLQLLVAKISEVRTINARCDKGAISLRLEQLGRSPAYALLLTVPGERRWILFFGGTGQRLETNDENEIQSILDRKSTRWRDFD